MPARGTERGLPVAAVMIGVDPQKGSHTAVAIDTAERQLATVRLRIPASQAARLLEWAAEWPERTWAVEGAGGHSDGRAYYDRKIKEGKTRLEALRALKRRLSNTIYQQLRADSRRAAANRENGPEGNRGTALYPARPAHTPNASSSDEPLPGPGPAYARPNGHHQPRRRSLDNKEELVLDGSLSGCRSRARTDDMHRAACHTSRACPAPG